MNVENNKLCSTYRKVQLLQQHMMAACPGPQEPTLRIMDLRWAIQDMYALKIDMFEVSFAGTYLKGKVERYANNSARVLVRASLSDVEKRSTAVKELCHLVIDEKEDWSPLGVNTINEVITDASMFAADGIGHTNPSAPLVSEALAILASSELMYPGEYHAADQTKLDQQQTTLSAIALQHEVPGYLIQHAFTNRPLRDRVYAQIAAEVSSKAA
ncbi:hypothetical protein [Sphingobium boeckii]|uniref:IrrE N-terminal-like domain-containing protein n=1 Tax=Sphingobium boeckii TaxID=1082345 RepID=A0A7W9EF27_9SPHN|nr:hypothetical protein [Sphingobium boeckii]MBB5685640.1 hypothetical protein [Sphingobium boeckii]